MSNIYRALKIEYEDDVQRIRNEVTMLSSFSEIAVERLWRLFSSDLCAQWLIVSQDTLEQFKEWLDR